MTVASDLLMLLFFASDTKIHAMIGCKVIHLVGADAKLATHNNCSAQIS